MALGDGITWDETTPVDATTVLTVDDHIRDLRIGIRSRFAFEHEFPSSQSATSEAGKHKFITLQDQTAKPTLAGTQVAAVYCKTSALYFEDSAGSEIQITVGTAVRGSILQHLVSAYTTVANITSTMPVDNSIPQTGEGTQIMSATATPTNATSRMHVIVNAMIQNSSNQMGVIAIFLGTTADAIGGAVYAGDANAYAGNAPAEAWVVAGTTGAVTFYVRAGAASGNATFNGMAGTALLGSCAKSFITIEEIAQ